MVVVEDVLSPRPDRKAARRRTAFRTRDRGDRADQRRPERFMEANFEEASVSRQLLIAGAIALIAATSATGGRAAAPGSAADRVVYPTGVYPTDVQNVQAAVDQGGTVVLKARSTAGVPTHFNFGPPAI